MAARKHPPAHIGMLLLLLCQLSLLLAAAPCSASTALAPLAELAGQALSSGSFTDLSTLGGPAFGMDSSLLSLMQQALLNVFSMDAASLSSLLASSGSTLSSLFTGFGGTAGSSALGSSALNAAGIAGALRAGSSGPGGSLPPLPPLPSHHKLAPWAKSQDLALRALADTWASVLVKAQFSPGLQGFLALLGLQEQQEALIKWVCIIFPWTQPSLLLPEAVSALRDAYCVKALPAAAVSKLLAGPPKPLLAGPKGPGPVLGGPVGLLG